MAVSRSIFTRLPPELLEHIFTFAPKHALLVTSKMCSTTARLVMDVNYGSFQRLMSHLFQQMQHLPSPPRFEQVTEAIAKTPALADQLSERLSARYPHIREMDLQGFPKPLNPYFQRTVPCLQLAILIAHLPLQSLRLRNVPLAPDDLNSLPRQLACLQISGYKEVTDTLVEHLEESSSTLTTLTLGNCPQLKGSYSHTLHFPHLTSLHLPACTAFAAEGLRSFSQAPLTRLDLSDTAVSDAAAPFFQWNLREIFLNGCENITDLTVRQIGHTSPHLLTLHLMGCRQVTFKKCAPGFTHLIDLNLGKCDLQNETLAEISHSCLAIQALDCSGCAHLTDSSALILHFPQLRILDISYTALTMDAVTVFQKRHPHLVSVNTAGCSRLSAPAKELLPQNRKPIYIGY